MNLQFDNFYPFCYLNFGSYGTGDLVKKTLAIASLIVLAVIIGSFNASWAVDRPNTPECVDINGRFDADACLIQYIDPLKIETEQVWNRLLKLQGKSREENPWTFKIDSPACDPDSQYYDKTFCLVQTPGKLVVEKYRIREEAMKLEAEQKLKRKKTKLALAQAAIDKLTQENKELTRQLALVTEVNTRLSEARINLTLRLDESNKVAEDQRKRADDLHFWSLLFLIVAGVLATAFIILLAKYRARFG